MVSAAKGPEDLKKEVLDRNLCAACGLCAGMCPYIKTAREKAVIIHSCGVREGSCYSVCPRTGLNPAEMDSQVFGAQREDQALGFSLGVYFARAINPDTARAGQYGGVVTAMAAFALEQGIIDGAVLAGGGHLSPGPVLARTAGEVISCAGSRYTAVPTLQALNRAAGENLRSVGVVGRPCQVEAVRKGQGLSRVKPEFNSAASRVGLVIGLFCFWSLSPEFYGYLEESAGGGEILKVDIPLEGLTITTSGGFSTRPVDEVRPYIRQGCLTCMDCTSEWADLSVGSTEFDPEWNTLVVRTGTGRSLLNSVLEKNIIEVKPYPAERLPILRKAALNKKVRVLDDPGRPDYIEVPAEYAGEIKKQWEVLK